MLNVNDDMDDLFRRAAENYPLKTDSADWNKVLQKMSTAGPEAEVKPRKRNYRFLWLLLLLLPAAWIGTNYFASHNEKLTAKNNNIKEQTGKSQPVTVDTRDNTLKNGPSQPGKNSPVSQSVTVTDQNFKPFNKGNGVLKATTRTFISNAAVGVIQGDQNEGESNSPG